MSETVELGGASVKKIRLTVTPPARCSSCFQWQEGMDHVDFGSAWDGGSFTDESVAGGLTQHMDELIICRECMNAAAVEIGLGEVQALREQLNIERAANRILNTRNQNLVDRLDGANRALKAADEEAAARQRLVADLKQQRKATNAN